jgi:hypothetical protein
MALFGRQRDILLFNSINRELLGDVITQQVGYYKISLSKSTTNIYGEAVEKYVSDPTLLNALITRGNQTWNSDDWGPDVTRTLDFAFFRQDLLDIELVPEVGDVIFYYENYYEVDGIVENQLFVGKTPDYAYSSGLENFGSSISILCSTHLVPADKIGITKERG